MNTNVDIDKYQPIGLLYCVFDRQMGSFTR